MKRLRNKRTVTLMMAALTALALFACDTTDTSDYYGPRVVSTSPVNGAVNTPTGASISVQFNEFILASTVTTSSFLVRDVGASLANISGSISAGGNAAVFTPDSPLSPETTYLVTLLPTITDEHVNYMNTGYSWYFTTGVSADTFDTFSPAHLVVGQGGFSTSASGASASTLNSPGPGPFVYNSMIYVPDTDNNRVLGFMNMPVVNGVSADFALGQPGLASAAPGNSPSALSSPSAVAADSDRTFVADTGNNRVLIWESIAMTNAAIANIAVGQSDLYLNSPGCSAEILNGPSALSTANGRLVVSDTLNNRVLVWNTIPSVSNTPADLVLGQALMNSCEARTPAGADTLDSPAGVWTDGARLAVADTGNNRYSSGRTSPQ